MDSECEEIVSLLVRYTRAVDSTDWDLFRTCFTDDVVADYGDFGSWQGLDDFVAFMVAAHAGMGRTQHALSNVQPQVKDGRATSVSYVHAVTVLASHRDDWIDTVGAYEDEFIRGADGWRIVKRVLRTTRTMLSPSLSAGYRPNEPEASS